MYVRSVEIFFCVFWQNDSVPFLEIYLTKTLNVKDYTNIKKLVHDESRLWEPLV